MLTSVPFTCVVVTRLSPPSGATLERPKSATFAMCVSLSKMLLDLISRWMMGGLAISCRYVNPLADPMAMDKRLLQSNGYACFPVQKFTMSTFKTASKTTNSCSLCE